ncbi:hypothetical protein IGB42_01824 [Andreprevotia sp. IGB-42]|uniref:hypothetical protein n=1 Tax=Andreprevotia sp. IGB-42 TaxID=2497473 RepID=UPI001356F703|nr:hypothetical protein [Andreprevotia sp. IGB-42]KAF0813473.1 hypothetical protein IGB42_01824 [Andreprevotia sp. IGB-42]
MIELELTKAWLAFLSSLTWPIVVVIVLCLFRHKIAALSERLSSGEVAGAKFSFNETASGYIESRIDDLAGQKDPEKRAALAGEIKDVAAVLGGIHPISLSLLINAGEPGGQLWVGDTYLKKKERFEVLQQQGLASVETKTMSNGALVAELHLTDKGRGLLRNLGMETAVAPVPQASTIAAGSAI